MRWNQRARGIEVLHRAKWIKRYTIVEYLWINPGRAKMTKKTLVHKDSRGEK